MSGESRRNLRNELQRAGLLGGFAEFLNLEIAGSVLLLGVTALALIIANSPAHNVRDSTAHPDWIGGGPLDLRAVAQALD